MARIYFVLALFAITLLVTSVVLGLRGGDVNAVSREYRQALATLQDLTRQKEMDDPVEAQLAEARSAFDRTRERYQPIRTGQTFHFLVGLLAALVAVLINSISLTYFIGTSRWCREVVETYSLDPRLIERSTMIKRQNVPWALSGILLVLAMIALGGASDPGANISSSADWVVPHRLLAIGATCWIGWAFLQQVGLVGRHTELIEEILGLVEEMREGKGSEPAGSD